MPHLASAHSDHASRRAFLKSSAAGVAAGVIAAETAVTRAAFVAGSDVLKVGLIGCGSRGTGAATQALQADRQVKLTAMGDVFADQLETKLESLKNLPEVADKIDVPPERRFIGFDAYKQVLASGVDVVLLTTPPGFRPLHLKAAIDAGKHVFAEKPVAVDAPGVHSVLATCEEAKKKNLSVVSGLCLRYDGGFRETVQQIHAGAVGDILALQANDLRGPIWVKPRQPGWTDMEWQMRNWYYFAWLSGDFNVEQHVHYLDVCSWIMQGEYPVKATGTGGRQVRTGPEYGHIYDHHSVVYEFANGAKMFSQCRQQERCDGDMSVHVMGTKGVAHFVERRSSHNIAGANPWQYNKTHKNLYQQEHDELFASIRSGKPINNGEYMAKSSLLGIMGRMATYTGKTITWEQALNSKEDLTPPAYDWNAPLPTPPIAIPGVTKFV